MLNSTSLQIDGFAVGKNQFIVTNEYRIDAERVVKKATNKKTGPAGSGVLHQ
jgi:hypothetical protein